MKSGHRHFHFLVTTLLLLLAVVVQSYFFARIQNPWFHLDVATVLVVYMAIEHSLLTAFVKLLFAAFLLQAFSGASNGFYVMFHVQVLAVATLISRQLVLQKFVSKICVFFALFALKWVLAYFVFVARDMAPSPGVYLDFVLPGFIGTSLAAIPMFKMCEWLDGCFDVTRRRDDSGAMSLA